MSIVALQNSPRMYISGASWQKPLLSPLPRAQTLEIHSWLILKERALATVLFLLDAHTQQFTKIKIH